MATTLPRQPESTAPSAAIERLLERLPDAKVTPSGWQARCPAHEDGTASLSIAVGDIAWRLPSTSPWPTSAEAIAVGRDALAFVDDDLAIEVIEHLLVAVVDRDDELRAVRAVLSVTLGLLHDEQREAVRLRRRNIELLERQRAAVP